MSTIVITPRLPPEPQPKMHKAPCKHCPSAHHPPDPESADMQSWPHEEKVRHAFPCAWAGKRYCKGYCDFHGVTNADLAALHSQVSFAAQPKEQ